jgi:large subunit ribosomal protein L36e
VCGGKHALDDADCAHFGRVTTGGERRGSEALARRRRRQSSLNAAKRARRRARLATPLLASSLSAEFSRPYSHTRVVEMAAPRTSQLPRPPSSLPWKRQLTADPRPLDDPSDLPWGLNRGHPTTVIPKAVKPSNRKGKQSQRAAFVKSIVREVSLAPTLPFLTRSNHHHHPHRAGRRLCPVREARHGVDPQLQGQSPHSLRHAQRGQPALNLDNLPSACTLHRTRRLAS